jgi:hypothetical protein
MLWNDEAYSKKMEIDPAYEDIEVSSLRKYAGERQTNRILKLNMYKLYLDMHLYEESEQGLDIWTRDALVYNMEKFKMD